MNVDRKEAIRAYKETPRPMGVARVRLRSAGRSLVGATGDLPAMLNRHRAQLKLGSHPCRELQQDWNEHGEGAFDFEVLDELEAKEQGGGDPKEELRLLEDLWREKLAAAGESLYPFRGPIR
jgi:hypothetical protein